MGTDAVADEGRRRDANRRKLLAVSCRGVVNVQYLNYKRQLGASMIATASWGVDLDENNRC